MCSFLILTSLFFPPHRGETIHVTEKGRLVREYFTLTLADGTSVRAWAPRHTNSIKARVGDRIVIEFPARTKKDLYANQSVTLCSTSWNWFPDRKPGGFVVVAGVPYPTYGGLALMGETPRQVSGGFQPLKLAFRCVAPGELGMDFTLTGHIDQNDSYRFVKGHFGITVRP